MWQLRGSLGRLWVSGSICHGGCGTRFCSLVPPGGHYPFAMVDPPCSDVCSLWLCYFRVEDRQPPVKFSHQNTFFNFSGHRDLVRWKFASAFLLKQDMPCCVMSNLSDTQDCGHPAQDQHSLWDRPNGLSQAKLFSVWHESELTSDSDDIAPGCSLWTHFIFHS